MNHGRIDYYEILEVHPKASPEIIRKAYLALSKKYHPDTTLEDKNYATQQMTMLNEAYRVLSNTESHKQYDRSYNLENQHTNTHSSKNYSCWDEDKIQIAILFCYEIITLCSSIKKEPGFQSI